MLGIVVTMEMIREEIEARLEDGQSIEYIRRELAAHFGDQAVDGVIEEMTK